MLLVLFHLNYANLAFKHTSYLCFYVREPLLIYTSQLVAALCTSKWVGTAASSNHLALMPPVHRCHVVVQ